MMDGGFMVILRDLLSERAITQKQLAYAIGCDETKISGFVHSKRFPLDDRINFIRKIADFFNMEVEDFCDYDYLKNEVEINYEKWKQKNVEWMKDTFNIAGDGKDNVISMVYHGDEAGNVHCHALVIPVDERGHLNARRFINGSRAMSEHQTTYAKYMQSFGLKRGLKGSQARHKDIKRFYAELNQAISRVPEQLPGESFEKYMERSIDQLKTGYASALRGIKEAETKQLRHVNRKYQDCREAIEREFKGRHEIKKEVQELTVKKENLQEEIDNLNENLCLIQDTLEEQEEKAKKYDKFVAGLEAFTKEHPEQAAAFREEVAYILDYTQPEVDLSIEEER